MYWRRWRKRGRIELRTTPAAFHVWPEIKTSNHDLPAIWRCCRFCVFAKLQEHPTIFEEAPSSLKKLPPSPHLPSDRRIDLWGRRSKMRRFFVLRGRKSKIEGGSASFFGSEDQE